VGRRRALRAARGRRDHVPIAAAALERQPRRRTSDRPVLRDATELLSAARFTLARMAPTVEAVSPPDQQAKSDIASDSEVWRRLLLGTDPKGYAACCAALR